MSKNNQRKPSFYYSTKGESTAFMKTVREKGKHISEGNKLHVKGDFHHS